MKRKFVIGIGIGVALFALLFWLLIGKPLRPQKNHSLTTKPPMPHPSIPFSTTPPTTFTLPITTPPPMTTIPPPPTLRELFPDYHVMGTLLEAVGDLPKGYVGQIRNGKGGVFYRIYAPNGKAVRVGWEQVSLSAPKALALPAVDKQTIEAAANHFEFLSETDYVVWTNLHRLETYVLKKSPSGWELMKRMDCSAGDLSHPTPTGTYKVEAKYPAIGKTGEYTCPYAVGFFGNYLFHSIPLAPDRSAPVDARMVARISNGCIRLRTDDARWLYQTVPMGTKVVIF